MNKNPQEIASEILISAISNDSVLINIHDSSKAQETAKILGDVYKVIHQAVVESIINTDEIYNSR